jgi:protein phosphatase 1L
LLIFQNDEGHGGKKAAEYVKDHLYSIIVGHPSFFPDTTTALGTANYIVSEFSNLLFVKIDFG